MRSEARMPSRADVCAMSRRYDNEAGRFGVPFDSNARWKARLAQVLAVLGGAGLTWWGRRD